jgi:hypothetical protein
MLVPPCADTKVALLGAVHVYDVAPATAAIVYVTAVLGQTDALPLMEAGVNGLGITFTVIGTQSVKPHVPPTERT